MLRLVLTINGAWLKPAHLKRRTAFKSHCLPTVGHASVMARGCRLVKVEPRDPKSSERFPFSNVLQAIGFPERVSYGNRLKPFSNGFQQQTIAAMDDNILKLPDVPESNRRHDQEHGDPYQYNQTRTKCGWNSANMSRRGKLTDKSIEKYAEAGYYSAEFKAARRELAEKRSKKRVVRDGNFDIVDGRMIYRPV